MKSNWRSLLLLQTPKRWSLWKSRKLQEFGYQKRLVKAQVRSMMRKTLHYITDRSTSILFHRKLSNGSRNNDAAHNRTSKRVSTGQPPVQDQEIRIDLWTRWIQQVGKAVNLVLSDRLGAATQAMHSMKIPRTTLLSTRWMGTKWRTSSRLRCKYHAIKLRLLKNGKGLWRSLRMSLRQRGTDWRHGVMKSCSGQATIHKSFNLMRKKKRFTYSYWSTVLEQTLSLKGSAKVSYILDSKRS